MRVIDEGGNAVDKPDLEVGCVISTKIIRQDAEPIDNVTKFAWDDEDYEDGGLYHVWTPEEVEDAERRELAAAEAQARATANDDMLLLMADMMGGAL